MPAGEGADMSELQAQPAPDLGGGGAGRGGRPHVRIGYRILR